MVQVMDYDAGGYDYRSFWRGRDFEHWAESRAVSRVLARTLAGNGPVDWFVDLGGGFGRNLFAYRPFARNTVLVDYSLTNLRNAAQLLSDGGGRAGGGRAGGGRAGGVGRRPRVALVRADVYRLPFRDHAFDGAASIRLLHHLTDLDAALAEMGRVVGGRWLIDVPIRHHVLARLRRARGGDDSGLDPRAPLLLGSVDDPYWNFHLQQVRDSLGQLGWRTEIAASVNNLRRWEQVIGFPALRTVAGPVMRLLELLLQRAGRGWWGPSQFLAARRTDSPARGAADDLMELLACPDCHGRLALVEENAIAARASCQLCGVAFGREDGIWDFTSSVMPTPPASALPGTGRSPGDGVPVITPDSSADALVRGPEDEVPGR
jgi:SAM-dependent methyltransferase